MVMVERYYMMEYDEFPLRVQLICRMPGKPVYLVKSGLYALEPLRLPKL